MKKIVINMCWLSVLLTAPMVRADWMLVPEQSSVHFVSVKKSSVGEIHTFKKMSGTLSDKGKLRFNVDLDSVETLIPIRNKRMREFLFETAKFQQAKVTANIKPQLLTDIKAGKTVEEDVDVLVYLHGKKQKVEAQLKAVALSKKQLYVTTTRPLMLNMADYGLVNGVERLREIAKLPSISLAVPATVNLVFEKQ